MSYYDDHAQSYIKNFLNFEMKYIYSEFEKYMPENAKILDIGCGPGRDIKYFMQRYEVEGLEPSKVMADYARKYTGAIIHQLFLEEFQPQRKYKGLWACASLLHIPSKNLPDAFKKISEILESGGYVYCSFKYGDFEGMSNGRYFTYLTEDTILGILQNIPLSIDKIWINPDPRPEFQQNRWLNIILSKNKS